MEKKEREGGNYFIPGNSGRSNWEVSILSNKTTNFNHYYNKLSFKIRFFFSFFFFFKIFLLNHNDNTIGHFRTDFKKFKFKKGFTWQIGNE